MVCGTRVRTTDEKGAYVTVWRWVSVGVGRRALVYLLSPVSCVLICVMVMRASDRRVRRAALRTLCVWCWG